MEEKKEAMSGEEPRGGEPRDVGGRLPMEGAEVVLGAEIERVEGERVDCESVPVKPPVEMELIEDTELPEEEEEIEEMNVSEEDNVAGTLDCAPVTP